MKPRNDSDSDDLWEPEPSDRMTMEVICAEQRGPLGFDLSKRPKKKGKRHG